MQSDSTVSSRLVTARPRANGGAHPHAVPHGTPLTSPHTDWDWYPRSG